MKNGIGVFLSALGLLTLMGQPLRADPLEVWVVKLENRAGLGQSEMDVLFETVLAEFSRLNTASFKVAAAQRAEECDEACAIESTGGAHRVVLGKVTPFGNGYSVVLKLFDAQDKSLIRSETTGGKANLEDLLAAIRQASNTLMRVLSPEIAYISTKAVSTSDPQKSDVQETKEETADDAYFGTLRVVTAPPGATVYISRDEDELGENAGQAPVEKRMLPLTYWVTAEMTDKKPQTKVLYLDPEETETLRLTLKWRANPYKVWGHAALWTGAALVALGSVAVLWGHDAGHYYERGYDGRDSSPAELKQRARMWAGIMWGSFISGVLLMGTGGALWIVSPGDEAYFEKKHGIAPKSAGISYTRRF